MTKNSEGTMDNGNDEFDEKPCYTNCPLEAPRSGGVEEFLAMTENKKHALLNKFLTKTYHMIDSCDPAIASWNYDGLSFIIHDVAAFADSILPQYFKHSKFASFVRQLNFYSFRKIRVGEDFKINAKPSSNTVQFAHEFFRRGRPDLLHKISRVTKAQEPAPSEVKEIKDEIVSLHQDIINFSSRFDQRIQVVLEAVEADYQQRMKSIALSYQTLSALAERILSQNVPLNPVIPSPSSDYPLHQSLLDPKISKGNPKTELEQSPGIFNVVRHESYRKVDNPEISVSHNDNSGNVNFHGTTPSEEHPPTKNSVSSSTKSPLSVLSGIACAIMQDEKQS